MIKHKTTQNIVLSVLHVFNVVNRFLRISKMLVLSYTLSSACLITHFNAFLLNNPRNFRAWGRCVQWDRSGYDVTYLKSLTRSFYEIPEDSCKAIYLSKI